MSSISRQDHIDANGREMRMNLMDSEPLHKRGHSSNFHSSEVVMDHAAQLKQNEDDVKLKVTVKVLNFRTSICF